MNFIISSLNVRRDTDFVEFTPPLKGGFCHANSWDFAITSMFVFR